MMLTGAVTHDAPLTIAVTNPWIGGVAFAKSTCFTTNTSYTPDMDGQASSTESSAEACRSRCASVSACAHFSYKVSTVRSITVPLLAMNSIWLGQG